MATEAIIGENPLETESIRKLLIKFALPVVITFLVNNLYNLVDQIFIGHDVGYMGNAATTVSFPIVSLSLSISLLIGAGGSAYASIKLGEKKFDVAEKILGNMFILLIIVGVLFAIFGLIYIEPLLRLFGATNKTMPYAKDYASIIIAGMPFMMVGAGISNMTRTDGNPKLAMISMLIGAALNTILDPIYIFVFHWGVKGAAIATITSQFISSVVLINYFIKHGNMRLRKSGFKLDLLLIISFISLGISSFITHIANSILQIILNNSLVYYGEMTDYGGDMALSAMGIVLKITMILIGFNVGIGTGSQPIIGYNVGAKKYDRVRKTYIYAVTTATIISAIGWSICMLLPEYVIGIFGKQNEMFTEFAVKCMTIYLIGVITAGFQIVSTSYFQSTGQPFKASMLSMLRQLIILIPLVVILPLKFGIDGILYAGPIADISAAIIVFIFIIFEMKRLNKLININNQGFN